MSHNSAKFYKTFHFQILYSDCRNHKQVLNSTCQTISVGELLQFVNFDGLTFLTALVLFNLTG